MFIVNKYNEYPDACVGTLYYINLFLRGNKINYRGIIMKLKTLLIIHAMLACAYGLAYLLVPEAAVSMFGIPAFTTGGIFILRYLGAVFLFIALLLWLARNAESGALKAIVQASFVGNILCAIVILYNQFAVRLNDLMWLSFVLHILLALGYGYFQFIKKSEA